MRKTSPCSIASSLGSPPPPLMLVAVTTALLAMLLAATPPLANATTTTGNPGYYRGWSSTPSFVVAVATRSGGGGRSVGRTTRRGGRSGESESSSPPSFCGISPSIVLIPGRPAGHPRMAMRFGDGVRLRAAVTGDDDVDGVDARGDEGGGERPKESGDPEPDLFDYFDPRISPHMYPGGIPDASSSKGSDVNGGEDDEGGGAASSPPGTGGGGRALRSTVTPGMRDATDALGGPTLGIVEKVGVLLIDHGSRREESNLHLETIAAAYQSSPRCPPHFVVAAAHMEIARPSIEDGMRDLIMRGASRIVCHPYFLSPGRHAMEDVPRLIDEALDSIQADAIDPNVVEVVTTDPIGSSVNALVDAIGDVVEDAVKGRGFRPKDDGLGFFGDIMRQMEEMENQ